MKLLTDIKKIKISDIVIVANNRQTLTLKRQYQKINACLPKIFTWDNLLNYLWEQSDNYYIKRLISNDESYYLFYKIIQSSNIKLATSIAREVLVNYSWCKKQCIPFSEIEANNTIQEYFLQWVKQYRAQKQKYNIVDIFDLPDLIKIIDASFLSYGFKALTKQQKLVFKQLKVKPLEISGNKAIFNNKTYKDLRDEIADCIKWAKDLYMQDSKKSIAIIVPELDKYYYYLNYNFNNIFTQNLLQTKDKSFNISLGKPLTKFNIIKDLFLALKVSLQITNSKINCQDLIKLLLSKFICNDSNHRFIKGILELEQDNITKTQLLEVFSDSKILTNIVDNLRYSDKDCHQNWLNNFCEILNIWQFNQTRLMTSDEYQIWQKYLSSSLILNILSNFSKYMSFATALFEFETMLERVIFQPQSGAYQIQIMGLLEAEGLSFDYSWIIGATNEVLPPVIKPLRFVENTICKKYQVPRCEYNHIMSDSKKSIDLLSMSSSKAIISFSQTFDGSINFGSKFIDWNAKCQQLNTKPDIQKLLCYVDDKTVSAIKNTTIKKGVKTLKEQIACPFKGFANRLGIDEYKNEVVGFSSLNKGNILHSSLEHLYNKVRNSEILANLSIDALDILVGDSIDIAMLGYKKDSFYQIMHKHIAKKIAEFLELEKSRDNWRVVELEGTQQVKISQLKFFIRFDRIDENSNGELIIFDYKSGKASTSSWCGSIPEPQLPIYAINSSSSAICFVNFKDQVNYQAMMENNEILDVKQKLCADFSWQEQKTEWQYTLEQAADDFYHGIATVAPKKYACKYCNLSSFCRVSSKQL